MKTRMSVDENQMVIKPDLFYSVAGWLLVALAVRACVMIPSAVLAKEYDFLIFLLVLIIMFGAYGLLLINDYGKTIIINQDGVCSKLGFFKKFLPWSEIKDYGFIFDGMTSKIFRLIEPKKIYALYFAPEEQKFVKLGILKEKILKGKMIKRCLVDRNNERVRIEVLRFCKKYTRVRPYNSK